MEMRGMVALITGAGSGLGKALAITLASHGSRIILAGRRKDKLNEVAKIIFDLGGEADVFRLDVSDPLSVESVVSEVRIQCGGLDILINNAAFFPPQNSLQNTTLSNWDQAMNTNLRGAFLMIKGVLPIFLEQSKGIIINISVPNKHMHGGAAYFASKCGLDSLTKTVAYELKESGISVYGIEPPIMKTERNHHGINPMEVAHKILALVFSGEAPVIGKILRIEERDCL